MTTVETTAPICLVFGALISLVVSALKKLPLVGAYPKTVAFVLSVAISVVGGYLTDQSPGVLVLVSCILVQFAGAIGTHEAVVHPLTRKPSS